MLHFDLSAEERALGLRAMKAVALANDEVSPLEQAMLTAAAGAFGVSDALEPASPEELAAAFPEGAVRDRLVEAQLLMALVDGDLDARELALVRRFADALGVHPPALDAMRHHARGHVTLLRYDLFRRSPYRDIFAETWKNEGIWGIWNVLGSVQGLKTDPELAWRYKQLGLLPEGTLGRVYWAHMTERRFPFPGEVKGFPERMVRHDLCHVLGGYDTDGQGETDNAAFICGFLEEQPFTYLLMALMQEQVGVEVFPGDTVRAMSVDPAAMIRAFERGSRVRQNLYAEGWDYWSDMALPIDEVRERLGIEVS